jgi:sugar-phosphatase
VRLPEGKTIEAKGVLFDLDGTLVCSNDAVERIWRRWAALRGVDADKLLQISHGRRTIDTLKIIAPRGCDVDAESAYLAAEELKEVDGIFAVRGARSLLEQLKEYPWGVVTSAPRGLALHRLKLAGLPLPKVLVTAEDVTSGKPSPDGYLLGSKYLESDPRHLLAIEDAIPGLMAAHAAGCKVLALSTTIPPALLDAEDWVEDFSRLVVSHTGGRSDLAIVVQR